MLEPIREVLDAGLQSDSDERDSRWVESIRRDVMNASVDLECEIIRRDISLRDIVDLKAGDIIPVNMPECHVVTANGVPMFEAKLGKSNDNLAVRVMKLVNQTEAKIAVGGKTRGR